MDNTQLLSDYHFSSSRLLTKLIVSFYSVTACLSFYYLSAIKIINIPLSLVISIALIGDALRLCRNTAWQVADHAIVRLLYSSRERICYLYSVTGEITRAKVESVLCCFPGVLKVDLLCLERRKRYFLFIAQDQLSPRIYHQFCLRMEAVCKMSKY